MTHPLSHPLREALTDLQTQQTTAAHINNGATWTKATAISKELDVLQQQMNTYALMGGCASSKSRSQPSPLVFVDQTVVKCLQFTVLSPVKAFRY